MTPCKLTHSGVMFDLTNPNPHKVHLCDIAHALARITRFDGHGDRPFTDAQHSVIVCDLATPALKRHALMHDAHEAYTGDCTSPMKTAMRWLAARDGLGYVSDYDAIEDSVRCAVAFRFNLPQLNPDLASWLRYCDDQAALLEVVLNGPRSSEEYAWPLPEVATPASAREVWSTDLAESIFLSRAKELWIQ